MDSLPEELLLNICELVRNDPDSGARDLQRVRLSCRRLAAAGGRYLLPEVRVSVDDESQRRLAQVASHPTVRLGVRRVVLCICVPPDGAAASITRFAQIAARGLGQAAAALLREVQDKRREPPQRSQEHLMENQNDSEIERLSLALKELRYMERVIGSYRVEKPPADGDTAIISELVATHRTYRDFVLRFYGGDKEALDSMDETLNTNPTVFEPTVDAVKRNATSFPRLSELVIAGDSRPFWSSVDYLYPKLSVPQAEALSRQLARPGGLGAFLMGQLVPLSRDWYPVNAVSPLDSLWTLPAKLGEAGFGLSSITYSRVPQFDGHIGVPLRSTVLATGSILGHGEATRSLRHFTWKCAGAALSRYRGTRLFEILRCFLASPELETVHVSLRRLPESTMQLEGCLDSTLLDLAGNLPKLRRLTLENAWLIDQDVTRFIRKLGNEGRLLDGLDGVDLYRCGFIYQNLDPLPREGLGSIAESIRVEFESWGILPKINFRT